MKKHFLFIAITLFSFSITAQTLTDSLIAYYLFNGNANDVSGNGNNGTIHGVVPVADRYGNSNSAYLFGANNDTILYSPNSTFKPTTFPISISAWVKSNCIQNTGIIFKNDFGQNVYTGVLIGVTMPGGNLVVSFGDGGPTSPGYRRSKTGTNNINDNQWHFVAGIIRNATDMDLWIDCKYEIGSYSGTGGPIAYSNNPGCSGEENDMALNSYYGGVIDDIRFYHRELNQNELELLSNTPSDFLTPTLNLGPNITTCDFNSVLLSPNGFSSYLWSTGATTSTVIVDSAGVGVGSTLIYLTAEKGFGCSVTDSITITFIDCSNEGDGTQEINSLIGISIYPNPTNDFTVIVFNNAEERQITISDLAGRIVLKSEKITSKEYKLDVRELNVGMYLCKVIPTSGNSVTKSIVVSH